MSGARSCNRGVLVQNATTYSAPSRNHWRNRAFHLGNALFLVNASFPTFFLCLVNKKKKKKKKNKHAPLENVEKVGSLAQSSVCHLDP